LRGCEHVTQRGKSRHTLGLLKSHTTVAPKPQRTKHPHTVALSTAGANLSEHRVAHRLEGPAVLLIPHEAAVHLAQPLAPGSKPRPTKVRPGRAGFTSARGCPGRQHTQVRPQPRPTGHLAWRSDVRLAGHTQAHTSLALDIGSRLARNSAGRIASRIAGSRGMSSKGTWAATRSSGDRVEIEWRSSGDRVEIDAVRSATLGRQRAQAIEQPFTWHSSCRAQRADPGGRP
jgi:hypothetical protein